MMIPLMSNTVVTQTMQQAMTKVPWLKSAAYKSYHDSMTRAMLARGGLHENLINADFNGTPRFGSPGWAHKMATSGRAAALYGAGFSAEAYQQLMNQYNLTQQQMMNLNKNTPNKTSINALLQNRKFASIIGG